MTWVIATNVPFLGYAVAISDIRVTFGEPRREKDCLQKIYSVGQDLAVGFAGSVEIGFEMVETLQKGLKLEDPGLAWDPTAISMEWPAKARNIFRKYPVAIQKYGCELILLGAHPSEDVGVPGIGRPCIYSFSWPDFEPVQAKPYEVLSIGSGSGVLPYRELLKRYSDDHEWRTLLMQGESMPGGTATMLASSVTAILKIHPMPGISPHLHLCIVRRGEVQIWPNDHSYAGRWEAYALGPPSQNPSASHPGMNNVIMPPVATTFAELRRVLKNDAVGSVACEATVPRVESCEATRCEPV
jgi:hypothetical protein